MLCLFESNPVLFHSHLHLLSDGVVQMSLRDVDVVPDFGVNAFANLTAAVNGDKQGASLFFSLSHSTSSKSAAVHGL
jgi:hypothetical protein